MTKPPKLGLSSASATVIASMIGAGVFTTTGFLAADLKHQGAIILVWFVGGIYALLGAICYGRLAKIIPKSGGEYSYLSEIFNPNIGWLAGWISLIVGFSAPTALAASAFGHYLTELVNIQPLTLATVLILVATTLHAFGTIIGNRIQVGLVLLKLLAIVGFIGVAFWFSKSPAGMPTPGEIMLPESWPDIDKLALSLLWVSFSYSGWNAAVYITEEVKDNRRTLPLALAIGTTTVTILYVLLNSSFLKLAGLHAISGKQEVALVAAQESNIEWFANATIFLVALALSTSVFAMTQLGPRVYARMAKDNCAPKVFCSNHANHPPRAAIYFQAGLALTMLWSASFESILTVTSFALILSTTVTCIGLIKLDGIKIYSAIFLGLSFGVITLSVSNKPHECFICLLILLAGFITKRQL